MFVLVDLSGDEPTLMGGGVYAVDLRVPHITRWPRTRTPAASLMTSPFPTLLGSAARDLTMAINLIRWHITHISTIGYQFLSMDEHPTTWQQRLSLSCLESLLMKS